MKKILLLCFMMTATAILYAQNVQLHYDFGQSMHDELKDRPEIMTTIEMDKTDSWGSTYFYVDMGYGDDEMKHAYWEFAREIKFWRGPISIHAEYNGGMKNIKDSWLGGFTYTSSNRNGSKGYTLSAMYKHICGHDDPSNFQFTTRWYMHIFKGAISFTGYADLWSEKHKDIKGKEHDFMFVAEPQAWINLHKIGVFGNSFKLSLGAECEISNNLRDMRGWSIIPRAAVKWNF